jgi:heptose I phosphotransferase
VWQRADWPRFVEANWAEQIMTNVLTDRFHAKQGRSTGRWVLERGEQRLTIYLKRHYQLPRWRGLLAALWPEAGWSPAMRERRHLEWARAQGLPVPDVVAAGEYIGPWGRLQSFLAVEELTDMLPLHEAIPLAASRLDPDAYRRWKHTLVLEMARLACGLHDRRVFHKDLYLCHFYIPRRLTEETQPWRGKVHLIDLHRLGKHRWTWRIWQVKDLAQLLFSTAIEGINNQDRLRFWHAYRGTDRGSWAARLLKCCIMFKWRRYQRHNKKIR